METLDQTSWDVVIAGTGLTQSLLALSLSRSGLKTLHLDRNPYYGGDEAAFSLDEAAAWAAVHASDDHPIFRQAHTSRPPTSNDEKELGPSRAYSIALAPQLVHARSNIVPALVSSRVHNQLEFQAVGAFFTLESQSTDASPKSSLNKVPSGREEIFTDAALDMRTKRSLMKFLKFVASYDEQEPDADIDRPFPEVLEQRFGLPSASLGPLLALTLSQASANSVSFGSALPAIARHLKSIGTFGPGFSAVLPKWGGLSELAQISCRACAVGGGVYVLNKGHKLSRDSSSGNLEIELDGGDRISTKWLVESTSNTSTDSDDQGSFLLRRTVVVSSSLAHLFPPTSEGGVVPAGAIIFVSSQSSDTGSVYVFAHSSEAGVLYMSIRATDENDSARLDEAMTAILSTSEEGPTPRVLWQLEYLQREHASDIQIGLNGRSNVIALPSLGASLALEDGMLDQVRKAWRVIAGEDDDGRFLVFEARDAISDERDVDDE